MSNNVGSKWKMGSLNDCFSIGSLLSCKTCFNCIIEGEVLAFDSQTKILILKCSATNKRPSVCDINFVNLNFVSDVRVIKEGTTTPPAPHSISISYLNSRLKKEKEHKQRIVNALRAGVSTEGQDLFLKISNQITELKWDGLNIVVFDNVTIAPPYRPENIIGPDNGHIRKIVEKFYNDMQYKKKEIQSTAMTSICNTSSNSSNQSRSNVSNNSNNDVCCSASVPQ